MLAELRDCPRQSLHDLRPLECLDSLRCLRKRSRQCTCGRNGGNPANRVPDKVFSGRISNIGPVLDPALRHREGSHRSPQSRPHAHRHVRDRYIPRTEKRTTSGCAASAIYICMIAIGSTCRRETRNSVVWRSLPAGYCRNKTQEIISGISLAQQVVANALVLQNTVEH